ncbi:MAG: hypothetical protein SCJ93_04470 [Bacillota bacterium]|nr:hypothetical protein [Bacillota bacterium]
MIGGLISGLLFAWILQGLEFDIGYKILEMLTISSYYYYPFFGFLGLIGGLIKGDD